VQEEAQDPGKKEVISHGTIAPRCKEGSKETEGWQEEVISSWCRASEHWQPSVKISRGLQQIGLCRMMVIASRL